MWIQISVLHLHDNGAVIDVNAEAVKALLDTLREEK